jgi:2-C-methyl-D-erythritol 2,4-cyclodiphosphate synthase
MAEPVVRVGLGFDVHAWSTGGTLRLGGIRFDDHPALAAHSDGDVVCHAIADALLGAAGLGDLGEHFPEDDASTAGVAGPAILEAVRRLVTDAGWRPGSCDATVICDRPAVSPRRDEMRTTIAEALGFPVGSVSVKATRPEGLGLVGEGVGCMAVATLA